MTSLLYLFHLRILRPGVWEERLGFPAIGLRYLCSNVGTRLRRQTRTQTQGVAYPPRASTQLLLLSSSTPLLSTRTTSRGLPPRFVSFFILYSHSHILLFIVVQLMDIHTDTPAVRTLNKFSSASPLETTHER
ncbi:hypothetical protein BDW22DRAFT_753812 [Trametopsis cervina]|nr:hypothetical protein BDW22DRAFT_753812 [Trametopsis cervina]